YLMTRRLEAVPLSLRRRLSTLASALPSPGLYRAQQDKVRNFLIDAASTPEEGYLRRLTLLDMDSRHSLYSPDLLSRLDGWDSRRALQKWVRRLPMTDFRNRMLYADTHFYCPEDCLTKRSEERRVGKECDCRRWRYQV